MKELLLSILRDEKTEINQFRSAARKLSYLLAGELFSDLCAIKIPLETPIARFDGLKLKNDIVFIPILRSALSMLPAFLDFYPFARVGFLGLRRDEKTSVASMYYSNIPKISGSDDVIVLDPMIATGGTAVQAIQFLIDRDIAEDKIRFISIIASRQGIDFITSKFSDVVVHVVNIDSTLTKANFISPGLGDFGDRFFGTL